MPFRERTIRSCQSSYLGYNAPVDLVTGAVVIIGLQKVAAPAAQVLTGVIGRLLGAPADALGDVAAHPIREWQRKRVQRAEQVVLDAAKLVSEKKGGLKAVPGRILLPTLEHSSVEEDAELRKVWAQLLASAAMPDPQEPVLTAYPHILAELTPLEVKILDFVLADGEEKVRSWGASRPMILYVFRRAKVCKRFRITPALAMTIRDNFMRLNLLQMIRDAPDRTTNAMWPYFVTRLGLDFHRACQGPK
jgi:hypothetical protein